MTAEGAQQYGRVRRLASRYCLGVETQVQRIEESARLMREQDVLVEHRQSWKELQNKNDWEALVMFLIRLRKCLILLGKCRPELPLKKSFLKDLDDLVPDLIKLRDFEEHFVEYSSGKGKNKNFQWGHLESYVFGEEQFANGVGKISNNASKEAAKLAWLAILSVEEDARKIGWLSWDDRYGNKTPQEETQ